MDPVTIPTVNLPALRERLDKLATKADTLGVPAPQLVVANLRNVTVDALRWNDHGILRDPRDGAITVDVSVVDVHVTTDVVTVPGGWTIAAKIDHDANVVVATGQGAEGVVSRWRDAGNDCGHCGHNRARLTTYVVVNDDGEEIQVGSTCLKDFLGHDVRGIVWLLTSVQTLRDDLGSSYTSGAGAARAAMGVEAFVQVCAAIIEADGYLSKTRAREHGGKPTAAIASDYFLGGQATQSEARDLVRKGRSDTTDKLAADAVAWAASLEDQRDDYLDTLNMIATQDWMPWRMAGFAASIVPAYQRHLGRQLERQQQRRTDVPRGRHTVTGVVLKRDVRYGNYGPQVKLTVDTDEHGRLWGTAPKPLRNVEAGARLTFTATLEPSSDDPTFGFFRQPRNGAVTS